MGGTALVAATVATTASSLALDNAKRRNSLKSERKKIVREDKNRKNVLEEQLARRRAIVASTGSSDSKSFNAVQNRTVKNSIDNMYLGSSSNEQVNNWALTKNLLSEGQSLYNNNKSMIK